MSPPLCRRRNQKSFPPPPNVKQDLNTPDHVLAAISVRVGFRRAVRGLSATRKRATRPDSRGNGHRVIGSIRFAKIEPLPKPRAQVRFLPGPLAASPRVRQVLGSGGRIDRLRTLRRDPNRPPAARASAGTRRSRPFWEARAPSRHLTQPHLWDLNLRCRRRADRCGRRRRLTSRRTPPEAAVTEGLVSIDEHDETLRPLTRRGRGVTCFLFRRLPASRGILQMPSEPSAHPPSRDGTRERPHGDARSRRSRRRGRVARDRGRRHVRNAHRIDQRTPMIWPRGRRGQHRAACGPPGLRAARSAEASAPWPADTAPPRRTVPRAGSMGQRRRGRLPDWAEVGLEVGVAGTWGRQRARGPCSSRCEVRKPQGRTDRSRLDGSPREPRRTHRETRSPGRGLVATSAPRPVPDEVHGHRDTGSKEGGDTPSRRVTTSVLGRVDEHASGYRCRESDGDQEGDGIRRRHNGHDRRLADPRTVARAAVAL